MDWLISKWTWLLEKILNGIKYWFLKPEQKEHDKRIFLISNELLKEENVMPRLDELQSYGAYRLNFLSTEKFIHFFQHTGNQYMNRRLKNASMNVARELHKLLDFLATEFTLGNDQDPMQDVWIQPNIKQRSSRTQFEYEQFMQTRDAITNSFRKTYRQYRELIKRELYI